MSKNGRTRMRKCNFKAKLLDKNCQLPSIQATHWLPSKGMGTQEQLEAFTQSIPGNNTEEIDCTSMNLSHPCQSNSSEGLKSPSLKMTMVSVHSLSHSC
jgi:hypothetical protein